MYACSDFLFFVICETDQNALAFSFKRFLVGVWGYLLIATLEVTERSGVISNAGQKGSPHQRGFLHSPYNKTKNPPEHSYRLLIVFFGGNRIPNYFVSTRVCCN